MKIANKRAENLGYTNGKVEREGETALLTFQINSKSGTHEERNDNPIYCRIPHTEQLCCDRGIPCLRAAQNVSLNLRIQF